MIWEIAGGIIVALLVIRFFKLFAVLAAWVLVIGIVAGGIYIAADRIGDEMAKIEQREST